jgi:hypothetical protein
MNILNFQKIIYVLPPSLSLIAIYFSPRTNVEVKLVLLCVTFLFLTRELKNKLTFNKALFLGVFYTSSVATVFAIYASVKGNLGALDFFRVYGIWPLIYFFFFLFVNNLDRVKWFFQVSSLATLLISLYIFYVWGKEFGFPVIPFLEIELGTRVGIHDGYSQVTSHNVGMLSFLMPLLISIVMHGEQFLFRKSNKYNVILLCLGIAASLLSGRRAVLLSILLAPLCVFLTSWLTSTKLMKQNLKATFAYIFATFFLLLLVPVVLTNYLDWDIQAFIMRLDFSSSDGGSEDIRRLQGELLIQSFLESPIFGKGVGVGIPLMVRDENSPWSYELTYHMFLHNLGIVGCLLLFIPYILLFLKVIKISRSLYANRIHPWPLHLLNGAIGIVLSSATNPYLSSFDFFVCIFCLFIPINVVKISELKSKP